MSNEILVHNHIYNSNFNQRTNYLIFESFCYLGIFFLQTLKMSFNLQGQQFSVILCVAIFSIKTFKISLNLQGQYLKLYYQLETMSVV